VYKLRPIVNGNKLDACRKTGLNLLQSRLHAVDYIEGILAAAHDNNAGNHFSSTIEIADSAASSGRKDAPGAKEEIIRQGAESIVYKLQFQSRDAIAKERFVKAYRHPELDAKLRKERTNQEVRNLNKCRKNGIDVPEVLHVDQERNRIYMEFVQGSTVRDFLNQIDLSNKQEYDASGVDAVTMKIGAALGKMHSLNIVHGDLTTSNVMLRSGASPQSDKPKAEAATLAELSSGSLCIIDFGLSYVSTAVEDQAVDLYVLERALLSTHPNSDAAFTKILEAYQSERGSAKVIQKLEAVRARGRKKSMIG